MRRYFYIAARLENAERVVALRDLLEAGDWRCTYDWTTHGSVRDGVNASRIAQVAMREINGVLAADVVVLLLPGGRGAHAELGAALASSQLQRVVLWSETPDEHFALDERCSAFYHHPRVDQQSGSIEQLAAYLLEKYGPR